MAQLSPDTQEMLDSLLTESETLKRKCRLSNYYVAWQDKQPLMIGDDVLSRSEKSGGEARLRQHSSAALEIKLSQPISPDRQLYLQAPVDMIKKFLHLRP